MSELCAIPQARAGRISKIPNIGRRRLPALSCIISIPPNAKQRSLGFLSSLPTQFSAPFGKISVLPAEKRKEGERLGEHVGTFVPNIY
jgi:hypothetical protein